MKKTYIIIIILLAILLIGLGGTYYVLKNVKQPRKEEPTKEPSKPLPRKDVPETINDEYSYNINIIKGTNELVGKENYLISPFSIEVALNLLKRGANGDTLKEIEKILPNRTINNITIKDKTSEANALFIKEEYKDYIERKYIEVLQTEYGAELIYDKFTTPDKINDWTNEKTKGMIPKLVSEIDPDFVLGMANAIAIDVDWQQQFECELTKEGDFVTDGKTKKVEMMHQTYDYGTEYFKTDKAEGVIIPYVAYDPKTGEEVYNGENSKKLEFVGLLPNNDVKDYINALDSEEFKKIDENREKSSKSLKIRLSLPRFTYDYNYEQFKNLLVNLGIQKAFSPDDADFTNIITRENHKKAGLNNIYVAKAIHKTHIELNEAGTKAAAVTAFLLEDNAAIGEERPKYIDVNFNKPFIYMIRDSKTKELLFFGVVYSPNEWKGSTCPNEE